MKISVATIFRLLLLGIAFCLGSATAHSQEPKNLRNPFYAMDTSYNQPGLTRPQQLDLVKSLGFDGVSENIQPPAQMRTARAEIQGRGLRLFAVYASAIVTPQGDLTVSDDLVPVMRDLKGSGAIIWLHIGGKGPSFDSLNPNDPVCEKLRDLAEIAKAADLAIAIYPHIGDWTAKFGNAVRLVDTVNHPALGVTFNLCHCLAMGDEKNIPTLLQSARARLFTVTINGADSGVIGADWNRLIQPLGKGTFDTKIVLKSLRENHFKGSIGFQGFGIKDDARHILEPTMAAWKQLTAAP